MLLGKLLLKLITPPRLSAPLLKFRRGRFFIPLILAKEEYHEVGRWLKCLKANSLNIHQAVIRAQSYINEGYQDIVDIDFKTFFDEVDHCNLLQLVYRKIKCPITMCLIRKWLRAPILINGKLVKRRKGVPQGSPISSLLSNIMLHELDRELEQQGLRFVRYADDFSIYTKSKGAARLAGNAVFKCS
ncbi:reverse transcriptase domain-containing protein [Carboxylicivirga marina]|uniref:reverse transcriptase domain-containing protein n=1 Tax=Carboxylicivirga marina TaxID=2800988 RepID=UPI002595DB04|nr:reverse transcriptase domain-containing protein [uncultured Carboxylicivirga sp.]